MYHHGGAAAVCSRDEERALAARVAAGDREARAELIGRNLGLVCKIAGQYQRWADEEDLCQAGALGLVAAVDRWDPDRGVKFSTYAVHWIRMEIRDFIESERLVHVPNYQRYPRPRPAPMSVRVAESQAVAEACFREAMKPHLYFESTDYGSLNEGAAEVRVPTPVDPAGESCLDAVDEDDERHLLSELVSRLTASEQLVLRRRYGLDLCPACTQAELARELGVSREEVRRIEARAVSKLRDLAAEQSPPRDPCRGRDAHRHCACDHRANPNRDSR